MKTFLKFLKRAFLVLLVLAGILFAIRWLNQRDKQVKSQIKPNEAFMQMYKGIDREDPLKSQLPDMEISEIKGEYINGYHLLPKELKHKGAIIVFGGSEGGSSFPDAVFLAKNGYEVYSMYYFGRENQRRELLNVPIDFFEELRDYIKKDAKNPEPLTIYGGSKGAELALLLSSVYPDDIDHLVLYAPGSYVFQGLSYTERTPHSSWTYKGEELDFISTVPEPLVSAAFFFDFVINKPVKLVGLYENIEKIAPNKETARIDLSKVRAKMLIFAGARDELWHSAKMAMQIKEHYKGECELHIFEKAGHLFFGPSVMDNLALGGEYEANEQAKFESNRILLETLERWTK